MSLYYPPSEKESRGKTSDKEDKYTARFLELKPYQKIVQAITFHSSNKEFEGEMIMEVTLEPKDNGTRVNFLFKNGLQLIDKHNYGHSPKRLRWFQGFYSHACRCVSRSF
jgi:uncharacterized protein YndB with AHSA1/START domain